MPRMRQFNGEGRKHRGMSCTKKLSVSLPEDIIDFIDTQGDNRSKTIVTILEEYREKKQKEDLSKAYEEYSEFCKEDGNEFEEAAIKDLEGED